MIRILLWANSLNLVRDIILYPLRDEECNWHFTFAQNKRLNKTIICSDKFARAINISRKRLLKITMPLSAYPQKWFHFCGERPSIFHDKGITMMKDTLLSLSFLALGLTFPSPLRTMGLVMILLISPQLAGYWARCGARPTWTFPFHVYPPPLLATGV